MARLIVALMIVAMVLLGAPDALCARGDPVLIGSTLDSTQKIPQNANGGNSS